MADNDEESHGQRSSDARGDTHGTRDTRSSTPSVHVEIKYRVTNVHEEKRDNRVNECGSFILSLSLSATKFNCVWNIWWIYPSGSFECNIKMLLDFVPDLYESCFITNVTVRWGLTIIAIRLTITAFVWIVLTFNILWCEYFIVYILYHNAIYALYKNLSFPFLGKLRKSDTNFLILINLKIYIYTLIISFVNNCTL